MDTAKQATVDTTRNSTPTEDAQEKQVEALQREVEALKADAAAIRPSSDVTDAYLTDEEAHPAYP